MVFHKQMRRVKSLTWRWIYTFTFQGKLSSTITPLVIKYCIYCQGVTVFSKDTFVNCFNFSWEYWKYFRRNIKKSSACTKPQTNEAAWAGRGSRTGSGLGIWLEWIYIVWLVQAGFRKWRRRIGHCGFGWIDGSKSWPLVPGLWSLELTKTTDADVAAVGDGDGAAAVAVCGSFCAWCNCSFVLLVHDINGKSPQHTNTH